jgi:hypothetical protein
MRLSSAYVINALLLPCGGGVRGEEGVGVGRGGPGLQSCGHLDHQIRRRIISKVIETVLSQGLTRGRATS